MLTKYGYNVFIVARERVDRNLNIMLIVSVVLGLSIPGLERTPDIIISYMLGIMMFFLCSKVTTSEIRNFEMREILLFIFLRFMCFPILLYYIALYSFPQFAIGVLLIVSMPVGITTPALVGNTNFNGNVSLALLLTFITNLLAPIIIPLLFVVSSVPTEISVSNLSYTMFFIIFIPSVSYYFLVRYKIKYREPIKKNSSFLPIILLSAIIAIVISKQKHQLFADSTNLILAMFLCGFVFLCMYFFGWLYSRKHNKTKNITYSLCSGANNNALAIALASLYFPGSTVFFVIVSELAWAVAIPIFKSIKQ